MNTLRMVLPLSGLAVFLLNTGAQAATGKTLFNFQGGGHGGTPLAGVYLDPNGNLFGTLSDDYSQNKHQSGVVYELKGQGGKWTEKELHQFRANKGDGTRPTGTPIPDGTGALYGTTFTGGQYGGGIVFKLTPPSGGHGDWTYSIVYNFNANTEGNATGGGLIFDRTGSLYLTHESIGVQGVGTVSMLTPPAQGGTAWTNSTIYTFTGGADGAWPSGAPLVFDASGALYGVTQYGGGGTLCSGGNGCGTVYKLTPPAQGSGPWTETILYAFTGGVDGAVPNSNLVFDKNGNLFSTTFYGGTINNGVVFELSPPTGGQTAWTETVIHSFNGSDGYYPQGNIIMTGTGNLLVAARGGGASNAGTLIQLTPKAGEASWSEKILFNFTDDFEQPVGIAVDATGDIYGATEYGPGDGAGVAFKVHP